VLQLQRCHESPPVISGLADWHRFVGELCAYPLVVMSSPESEQEQGLSPFRAEFGTWNIPWYEWLRNHDRFLRPKSLIEDRKQRSFALRVYYPDFSVL
jgi:hypothetical protein